MARSKQHPSRSALTPRPKATYTTGKLKSFRQLPYHIALSQAARFEAWTDEVQGIGGPAEAANSDDFDPNLMERQ